MLNSQPVIDYTLNRGKTMPGLSLESVEAQINSSFNPAAKLKDVRAYVADLEALYSNEVQCTHVSRGGAGAALRLKSAMTEILKVIDK